MGLRKRVLFLSLTNDVGSDRIVSEMGRHGAACAVLGPRDNFAALPRCVTARFPFPNRLGLFASTFTLRRRLSAAVVSWRPDQIVPLDELAALLLRTIGADARSSKALRGVIAASLGDARGFAAACHRLPLMVAAIEAGVRVPAFVGATGGPTEAARLTLSFPLMVKRDHSSGSAGVVRVRNRPDLTRALHRARFKTSIKRIMARVAGFGRDTAPVLLQEYVSGRLAMHTVACRNGVVIDGASFEAVETHPEKMASTVLRPIANDEMAQAARKLVGALGCSGFVSFDFMLDAAGAAFLIEMNARPIGSTHLARLLGHDLACAFLTGRRLSAEAPVLALGNAIALFPKELERDPASPHLARGSGIVHDVPRNEPAVLAAYVVHLQANHPSHRAKIRELVGLSDAEAEPRVTSVLAKTQLS